MSASFKKSQVVALFIALDYVAAPKWSMEKLTEKVKTLPSMVDDDTEVEGEGLADVLKAIIKADGEIKIEDDSDVKSSKKAAKKEKEDDAEDAPATKAAKKTSKKAVKKPEIEDEEDDDDDDDDDDGDEEEAPVEPTYTTDKLVVVNVDDLDFAAYNPEHRTAEENTAIKNFAKQLLADGQVYIPILLQADGKTIIDGHRRVTASKLNGWSTIIARKVDHDADQVYASVNSTGLKLNGTDHLSVYLKSPTAVPEKISAKMDAMKSEVGKAILAKLVKLGLSTRTIATARRIANVCEIADDEGSVKTVTEWLIGLPKGSIGNVMRGLSDDSLDAKTLMSAIKKNKPIKFTAAVVE